jgi:hypothetical protein
MKAAIEDSPYTQQWPVNSDDPKVKKSISANKLWMKIVHNAWKSAERVSFSGIQLSGKVSLTVMRTSVSVPSVLILAVKYLCALMTAAVCSV